MKQAHTRRAVRNSLENRCTLDVPESGFSVFAVSASHTCVQTVLRRTVRNSLKEREKSTMPPKPFCKIKPHWIKSVCHASRQCVSLACILATIFYEDSIFCNACVHLCALRPTNIVLCMEMVQVLHSTILSTPKRGACVSLTAH